MRIEKLDGLRGIFCMMVICFHYDANLLPSFLANSFLFKESYIFVDFFFVLSGFVISYNYSKIPTFKSALNFIGKRFSRLFPLLFYTTTLFLLVDIVFNEFYPEYIGSIDSIPQLLVWYADSLLFLNAIFINTSQIGINGPSWSISAEMIAYLLFAAVSVSFNNFLKNYVFLSILILMYLLIYSIQQFTVMGDFGFARGALSFILGYFVSVFYKPKIKFNIYLEYALILLLIFEMYYLHSLEGVSKEMFLLFVFPLSFAFIIFTILHSEGLICKFLKSKFVQYLGNWSYSIYLNHLIVLLLLPNFIFKILKINANPISQIAVFILTVLSVVIYSKYTYKFIEVKGRSLLNTLMFKGKHSV